MNRTRDNKRPIEQIFVGKAGATTAHAGNEPLTNATTGYVDLVEGEIKIFSAKGYGTRASNVTIAANDTVTAAREIFVAVGNKSATDPNYKLPYPLPNRPYEVSESISGHDTIIYTYRAAKLPTFDTVAIGSVNVQDNTNYSIKVAFYGRDIDEAYSSQCGKPDAANFTYYSKDYTSLSWNTANATDDIIKNLGYKINQNSKILSVSKGYKPSKPVIAFAVDSTGTYGKDPRALSAGTFLPVVNTNIGLRGITLTNEMIASFNSSSLPVGATVVPIDLATAGGFAAAGTNLKDPSGADYSPAVDEGKADYLLILALDRDLVYEDRIPYVKTRIEVGLTEGFTSNVTVTKIQKGQEGEGLKRQWDMYWKNSAGQRIYSNYRGFEAMKIEVPSPVVADYYDVAIVEHFKVDTIGGTTNVVKPFKTIFLIPAVLTVTPYVPEEGEDPAVPAVFTLVADANTKALITNILLPWINSTDEPIVSVLG